MKDATFLPYALPLSQSNCTSTIAWLVFCVFWLFGFGIPQYDSVTWFLYVLTGFCIPQVPFRLNWANWRNWHIWIWKITNLPVLSSSSLDLHSILRNRLAFLSQIVPELSEFRQDYVGNYTIPSRPLATSILTRQDTSNSQWRRWR